MLHSLQVLSSTAASSAIAALSPGGVLMQAGAQQAINRKCIVQLLDNIDITYYDSCWSVGANLTDVV